MLKNIKLYSIYKIFSYDIFFYYAISFFFFTAVKNLSVSQILILEALYPIYGILLQIPSSLIVSKIGVKNSIVIANMLWAIGYIGYIIAPNMSIIIVSDIIFAIGNALKQITESTFLLETLKKKQKEDEFNKIEGKGIAVHHYIETITSILAGFLFIVNPYIPFILGAIVCVFSACIAIQFKEFKYEQKQEYEPLKKQISNLTSSIKNTIKNSRIQALILYSAVFSGIIAIISTYNTNFLQYLGIDVGQYALIFSVFSIIQGMASQNQYIIEKKTKNKTLTWLSVIFMLTIILVSVIGIINIPTTLIIGIVICIIIVQKIITGTYEVSMSKYIINFTNLKTAPNILATYNFFKNIGISLLLFLGALLIDNIDIINSYTILGISGLVIILIIISFMKTRVGIEPQENEA